MSGEPNVKGVTVTELKATGWTEVQRFMPDEEILDLFPDNGSSVANPLLRRAQAAEAEIERLTAAEPWVEGQLVAADTADPLCEDGKYVMLTIRVPAREVAAGPVDVRFHANPKESEGET